MTHASRRSLLQSAAAAVAWRAVAQTPSQRKMRVGVVTGVSADPEAAIKRVHDLGIPTCQVSPRAARIQQLQRVSDFAKMAGISGVQSHCGFIPENPNDPVYGEAVEAIRTVAQYCAKNGQTFRCETGQETPTTLVRAIHDVGLDNVGVNFDVANLILYGKANPLDAVDIFGSLILGVHAKDGLYPTDTRKLGEEVPIGQGKVDFPGIVARLRKMGYTNPLTIEREIRGEKQTADILAAKAYLEKLIG
jgi:sugar phosphate isomerase/epimerase